MATLSELRFSFLLRQFLLTHRYLLVEGLGELRLIGNGAILNKSFFSPPLFSLVWNEKSQEESDDIAQKKETLIGYMMKNARWERQRIENHLERMGKKMQRELNETSQFSIETIGDIHATNGFFYVIAHPLLFPAFPRLAIKPFSPTSSSVLANGALASNTQMMQHANYPPKIAPAPSMATRANMNGGMRMPHALPKPTATTSNYTPSVSYPPSPNVSVPNSRPATVALTSTQMTSHHVVSKPSPQKENTMDETKVLEKYLLISLFVLCVILIILYFVTVDNTNLLGSILR